MGLETDTVKPVKAGCLAGWDVWEICPGMCDCLQLYLTHVIPPDIAIAIVSITKTDNCRLISLFITISYEEPCLQSWNKPIFPHYKQN